MNKELDGIETLGDDRLQLIINDGEYPMATDREVTSIVTELIELRKNRGANHMQLPDIEAVSARVHDAWMQSKLSKGITTRKLESGEELMVPYATLSEDAKELDRGTVKAVYAAIEAAVIDK